MNRKTRLRGEAKLVDIAETGKTMNSLPPLQSSGRDCAASDIARKAGGKVWGVL